MIVIYYGLKMFWCRLVNITGCLILAAQTKIVFIFIKNEKCHFFSGSANRQGAGSFFSAFIWVLYNTKCSLVRVVFQ